MNNTNIVSFNQKFPVTWIVLFLEIAATIFKEIFIFI